ncbi:kinase-like domain-containing protein [Cunninghamella echinulata]|nr:kinase-like domain-containing protein [Cunninghamella echinulata]
MTTPKEINSTKSAEPDTIVGHYLIKEKIGQGSFATVYKAQHKDTGQLVAIKSVLRSKLTKKLLENLESEITILKAIRHDHIVGLSECHKTNTHIHLVMDYCSLGDLSQYIKRIRNNKSTRGPLGGLPEDTVRHFLKQLASALQFLRSQNLVHRDIKPQNLLLVIPKNASMNDLPTLQVADFGFARFLPNASLADTLCGSPLYMGPEILSYKKYDAKADLWSVGAVLYEMMAGRSPFRAQNHLELLKKIQDNNDKIQFPDEKAPHSVSLMGEDLKDLVRKLLKKDPVERISFEEFFNHPAIHHQPMNIIKPSTSTSSTSSSSATVNYRKSSFSRHSPHSLPARLNSPTNNINHHHHTTSKNNNNPYEPPPFATNNNNNNSTSHQDRRLSAHIPNSTSAWPIKNDSDRLVSRNRHTSEDASPTNSRGRSAKVEFKDNSHNDMHESGAIHKRTNKHGEEEDALQEYVVLDKRTIETNQFADELNASPRSEHSGLESPRRHSSVGQVAIPRRKSSTSSDQTGYPPSSVSPGTTPPFVLSRERRISAGALAKAISMASVRLFGAGHSPPNYNRLQKTMVGSPRGFMLMGKWDHPSPSSLDEDHHQDINRYEDDEDEEEDETIAMIERIACMGHAVAKFADMKFELLMNGRHSQQQQHPHHIGLNNNNNNDSILAAEALALHVKALALLELGFKTAKLYWKKYHMDLQQQNQLQHQQNGKEPMVSRSIRLNDAVQWMRERFNECLDRATFENSKCDQDEFNEGLNGNGACVEKLLYDRALELSRSAAVHELVGENIAECEQDYRTAIWMLEAILEVCDDKEVTVEEDDKRIINKFIDSIKQRINVLRKKILEQKDQYTYHLLNQNRPYEEN